MGWKVNSTAEISLNGLRSFLQKMIFWTKDDSGPPKETQRKVDRQLPRLRFELGSPAPFLGVITVTSRALLIVMSDTPSVK